jgi:hypothetical protein
MTMTQFQLLDTDELAVIEGGLSAAWVAGVAAGAVVGGVYGAIIMGIICAESAS